MRKTGKDIETAVKIREKFTDRPHESVRRMDWEWPSSMIEVGTCEAIMYSSDKWQKRRGDKKDYKHVAEGPQRLYLKANADLGGAKPRGKKIELKGMPDSFAILADSLGVQSKLHETGEYVQLGFPKSTLAAGKFRNGKVFCFVFDASGVIAMVVGEKLDVLKDGIVG